VRPGLFNSRVVQKQGFQREACSTTWLFNGMVVQQQGRSVVGFFNSRFVQIQGCPTAGLFYSRVFQQQVCSTSGLFNSRVVPRGRMEGRKETNKTKLTVEKFKVSLKKSYKYGK
jgi:hypothetical protein